MKVWRIETLPARYPAQWQKERSKEYSQVGSGKGCGLELIRHNNPKQGKSHQPSPSLNKGDKKMETKDTVMSEGQTRASFSNHGFDYDGEDKRLRPLVEDIKERQAEISFRAGMETALSKQLSEEQLSEHDDFIFKAGIKEVVESVTLILRLPHITVDNIKLLWQAKLKEWGNRWQEEKNNGTER